MFGTYDFQIGYLERIPRIHMHSHVDVLQQTQTTMTVDPGRILWIEHIKLGVNHVHLFPEQFVAAHITHKLLIDIEQCRVLYY